MGPRLRDQRGAALITVLLLILVLTVIGGAMVANALTEITIGYNQADGLGAHYMAEAGLARAAYELSLNGAWPGTGGAVALGPGTYDVMVAASGTVRFITATGVKGGARRALRAALKVVPRFAMYDVMGNTTVTLGAGFAGLTVSNDFPSSEAGAAHANNRLGGGTAITVNTSGTTVAGALTAQGAITDQFGANLCPGWPFRCDPAFGVLPFPELDVDGAGPSSYRSRAKAALDPVDSLNLYFHGGDPTSRCMSGGAWNFGTKETQRCWDKYISDRGANVGAAIPNAVFYVEFNASERTQYSLSTQAITHRGSTGASNGNGDVSLTLTLPVGVVAEDVMVAAVTVRGGSGTAITSVPAGWSLVPGGSNPLDNGTTLKMAIYYKIATATEPASYSWGFSSSQKASGGIQAYANVDTVGPIDMALGQTATTNAGQISAPSITTSLDGAMLIASFALASGTTFAPPAGMTERYDVASTGGSAATRTTSEGADQLQTSAGATGAKTATSGAGTGVAGTAHLLALAPRRVTVDCVDLPPSTVETLCIRSRPAMDSDGNVVYPNSDPRNVDGIIVAFRRISGTAVAGDIAMENLALSNSNYSHSSLTGDPAFLAGSKFQLISSGTSAGRNAADIEGIIYTFAGLDNPDVGGNLQGSATVGIDVQHGASLVNITLNGILMSNGAIALRDTASNQGNISVQYSSVVSDNLPSQFLAAAVQNVVLLLSWSSRD